MTMETDNMAKRLPSKLAIVCFCLLALVLADGAWAQRFACSGEAFAIQEAAAQLNIIDQSVSPFIFTPIGSTAGYLINNLGFRRTDGLLYGYRGDTGNEEVVSIDTLGAGSATGLGSGGLPAPTGNPYNSGDVSADGTEMYFSTNGIGTMHTITLPGLAFVQTVAVPSSGNVNDYAAHPTNGFLFGGDHAAGELVEVDPTDGSRTDTAVVGLASGGQGYGAAWFNAAGTLFLYKNDTGTLYEINDPGGSPTVAGTQPGPVSAGFNDGAACIQDIFGAAKEMTSTTMGALPATVTIVYTLENFGSDSLDDLFGIDDLVAVFGTHGADWTFTSISSGDITVNPSFDGNSDTQLIEQTTGSPQTLAATSTATITVTIELLSNDNATMDMFCNSVEFSATRGLDMVLFSDLTADGTDPDPDGDGSPDERDLTCFPVPVGLTSFSVE